MKFMTLSTLLLSFSTLTALAAPPPESYINMICVSEFPTTSFLIEQTKDELDVRVIHHNGSGYVPFRDALIVPNDLPLIQSHAQLISKLGNEWNFKWPRKSCNADSPMFFQCIGDAQSFETNGIRIQPFAISVSDMDYRSIWTNFSQKNVRLSFYAGDDKQTYDVTMNYSPHECVDGTNPAARKKLLNRMSQKNIKVKGL